MEANNFYHTVLHSLGFSVYMAGSRIYRSHGTYGGWTHVVNLVTIAGVRYLLDGGFGPQGPPRPVALEHGVQSYQIAPAQMRLMHEPIPEFLDQSQRVWVYQQRRDEDSEWAPMYCFTDYEFTPTDIESMNYAPWLSKQSFFTHKVVAVRFATSKETNDGDGPGSPGEGALEGRIDGTVTINQNVIKWRKGGKKIVELKFEREGDRIAALKNYFGIELSDEDRDAINGTASAVEASGMDHDE